MEFSEVLLRRYSCRQYTDQPVNETQLKAVLQAANSAPVGMGAYDTVQLTVIRNPEFLEALKETTRSFMNIENDPLYGAGLLILVSARPGMPPNIEFENAAAIIENMLLAATDQGLGCCYIMGAIAALNTNPDLVKKLSLPEGFVPVAAAAIRYEAQKAPAREPKDNLKTVYFD